MAAPKGPGRATDGVNANFASYDEDAQITLANSATLSTGQVVCVLTTDLGPANVSPIALAIYPGTVPGSSLVPSSAAAPHCEQVCLPNATGAGPVFGVYQGPSITNSTGAAKVYTIAVRQRGYGAVLAGSAAAGAAVNVGSNLISTPGQTFAIAGTAAPFVAIGVALATFNQTSIPLATSSGAQTVVPVNMAGIKTTTTVLVDIGTAQETVTPSAIGANADRFTATFVNAHPVNTPIAVIANAAGGSLYAVPAAGTVSGLVAAFIAVM